MCFFSIFFFFLFLQNLRVSILRTIMCHNTISDYIFMFENFIDSIDFVFSISISSQNVYWLRNLNGLILSDLSFYYYFLFCFWLLFCFVSVPINSKKYVLLSFRLICRIFGIDMLKFFFISYGIFAIESKF